MNNGGPEKMAQAVNTHYDYLFKVILVGAEERVKSGLLWAFTGNIDIISDYKKTIGVNFGINSLYFNKFCIKLQIWDISYAEHIRYLRPLYFKGASGCIMIIRSLKEAEAIVEEIQTHCDHPIPIFFILINDSPLIPHFNEYLQQLNIEIVESSFAGIEWLAQTMLTHRKTKNLNIAALYTINTDEIQATLNDLQQELLQSELERYDILRQERLDQLIFMKETLDEMKIPIVGDSVRIFTSHALIDINLVTGTTLAFPLKCDQCQKPCDRQRKRLCIKKAEDDGWSEELDAASLLILSTIFAFVTNQIPKHIQDQIKDIVRCHNYRKST
ncbi:MAG: hypothetical protein HWN65_20455 [Candidatus Helarchaeota archaeon]|nr:hypothetical protein [Candidatus Helarchaeota archaeon]